MEKNKQSSSAESTASSTTSGREQRVKQLNKLSCKISKPAILKKTSFHRSSSLFQSQKLTLHDQSQHKAQPSPAASLPQPHQRVVYKIHKNDFRDVVQKLTGPMPDKIFSDLPKHQISAPVEHCGSRPSHLLSDTTAASDLMNLSDFNSGRRLILPASPLPPLPAGLDTAESPVSAYMGYLRGSIPAIDSNPNQILGHTLLEPLFSPQWNNPAPLVQQEQFPFVW